MIIAGWIVVVLASYSLLLVILAGPHFFGHKIKAGEILEHNIFATRKTYMVDESETRKRREFARAQTSPVLKRDPALSNTIYSEIKKRFDVVGALQSASVLPLGPAGSLSPSDQIAVLKLSDDDFMQLKSELAGQPKSPLAKKLKAAKIPVSKVDGLVTSMQAARTGFATLSKSTPVDQNALFLAALVPAADMPKTLTAIQSACQRFLQKVGLHAYDNREEWASELYEFLPDEMDPAIRQAAVNLAAPALAPNVSVDQEATRRKLEDAVRAIKPVQREIEIGQLVVARDEPVLPEQLETLRALGLTTQRNHSLAAGISVALLTAYGMFGIFLYQYAPRLLLSPVALAMMSTLSIIVCGAALFLSEQLPQFIPLPAATLIISVTYGRRVSVVLSFLTIIFLAVSGILAPANLLALTAASATAALTSIKRRRDLMITGLAIGFMQMVGYFSAVLCGLSPAATVNLGRELPMQMFGGVISAILAIGWLPILESIFGLLTPYRIAELADPDQPLMRQLEENAPGTYQHSLAVANLAEGGTRAIGGDVQLARTGAMYHDIGKMVTPRYFIENQLGDKNPHDFMGPEESREKVLAHVTNGLLLANKYGLPKAVQAFIPEHQGTTIMAYFYHKACVQQGKDNVDPASYRYPGPKPQTKESAIVMLADVSEAVTHSMKEPTQEEVEKAIANVFQARWDDGQFDESGLSREELDKVRLGFVRVWRTLHHDRLRYPSTTTGRMPVPPQEVSKEESPAADAAGAGDRKEAVEAQSDSNS